MPEQPRAPVVTLPPIGEERRFRSDIRNNTAWEQPSTENCGREISIWLHP
jgi:hypothetical protein